MCQFVILKTIIGTSVHSMIYFMETSIMILYNLVIHLYTYMCTFIYMIGSHIHTCVPYYTFTVYCNLLWFTYFSHVIRVIQVYCRCTTPGMWPHIMVVHCTCHVYTYYLYTPTCGTRYRTTCTINPTAYLCTCSTGTCTDIFEKKSVPVYTRYTCTPPTAAFLSHL